MASLSSDSRLVGGASEAVDQLVLQYLDEAGYSSSLAALQAETRTPYARGALAPAQLRRLCCALQQLDEKDEASVQAVRKIDGGVFAQRSTKTITNLHSGSNVTAVRWVGGLLLSGGADRHICLSDPAGGARSVPRVKCDAGVVSLDVHQPTGLGLAGCMDGSILVLRVGQGELEEISRMKAHQKYAHCVRWHPSGRVFASGSFDHTICVFEQRVDSESQFERVQIIRCSGVVESIAWTGEGLRLVSSVRGSCDLIMYDALTAQQCATLPLDSAGGLPLNVLAIECSSDGKWISAATDRGRTLVLSLKTAQQVSVLSGHGFDGQELARPVHAWHASTQYLYATCDDLAGPIAVWDVWSRRVVHTLSGHSGQVRDMHVHPNNGALATCGFDKSIRIWSPHPAAEVTTVLDSSHQLEVAVQRMEL